MSITQDQSKSGGRVATSLQDKLAKLNPEKVLDVSNITPTGSGVVTIKRPTTKRSTKHGGPTLPIVSSNLEHYLMAIDMLPGGRTKYASEIQAVQLKLSNAPRSPGVKTSLSQKISPVTMTPYSATTPIIPTLQGVTFAKPSPVIPPTVQGMTLPKPSPVIPPIVPAQPTVSTITQQIQTMVLDPNKVRPLMPNAIGTTKITEPFPVRGSGDLASLANLGTYNWNSDEDDDESDDDEI